MRLIIRTTEEAASLYVANYIIERIRDFAPTAAKPFVLGLPTGSSPLGVYKILVERYRAGNISFENVVTFNMDEYIGIPRDHPQSYHTFMWENLFDHVNIHARNVHILDGNAPDLQDECLRYEEQIKAAGGIGLFLAGIGEDGHIAFNEPGSSLQSRTRTETLSLDTLLANSRFFNNDISKVPNRALTIGVQTVLDAREVVVIALGANKASALQHCIEEGVNHMWTLSGLQLHPHAVIVCDEEATEELKVKTVNYFKSIEYSAPVQNFQQKLSSALSTHIHPSTTPKTLIQPISTPTPNPTPTAITPPDSASPSPTPPQVPAPEPAAQPSHRPGGINLDIDPGEFIPDSMSSRIARNDAFRFGPKERKEEGSELYNEGPENDYPEVR